MNPVRFAAIALLAWPLAAETLTLNKDFVNKFKNSGTITVNLRVDEALKSPHRIKSGGDDGDIHMAGRDDVIRLPLVVEIMNARQQSAALTDLKKVTGAPPVSVTGVWRIWFEHLGTEPQTQGATVQPPADSNPAHLFEVHPVTVFDGNDVSQSFVPIPNYEAYDADKAFGFYEQLPATIQATSTAITISSGEGRYNYAEFVMERVGDLKPGDGKGLFVLANVFSTDNSEEKVNASPRRMVFIDGTPPADAAKNLAKGERLHVLGIPRVSLAEVAAIAEQSNGKLFSGTLPYEIIVVGVFPN